MTDGQKLKYSAELEFNSSKEKWRRTDFNWREGTAPGPFNRKGHERLSETQKIKRKTKKEPLTRLD